MYNATRVDARCRGALCVLPLIFLTAYIDHIQLKAKGQSSLLKYTPNRITFQGELRVVVKQERENVLHTLQEDYTCSNSQ